MPGWVDSPVEEKAWSRAKGIVARQRKKKQSDFNDSDWALTTHIAKNILKSSAISASVDEHVVFALANVERLIDSHRKKDRRSRDSKLSASDQSLVSALSQVAAISGNAIAEVRNNGMSRLSAEDTAQATSELLAVADKLQAILSKVRN